MVIHKYLWMCLRWCSVAYSLTNIRKCLFHGGNVFKFVVRSLDALWLKAEDIATLEEVWEARVHNFM